MRLYKGMNRIQLIDLLADYAAYTAVINNKYKNNNMNTDKHSYINLYQTYPIYSKKYPSFSLSVMYDNMVNDIERAKEISTFSINVSQC